MNESAGRQDAPAAARHPMMQCCLPVPGAVIKENCILIGREDIGDLDFLGMGFFATPTGRTIVSRVNNFKGGVKTDIFFFIFFQILPGGC